MSAEISKPAHLETGDRVAIVTPASLPPNEYRADNKILRYLVEVRRLKPQNFTAESDTPESRAESFNNAVKRSVKVLFPLTSNRYSNDILDRIDWQLLKEAKPIFCTFSAASVLLHAIHERANLVTFYGPHISFIYNMARPRENVYTQSSFWNMLMADNKAIGLSEETANSIFKWNDGQLTLKNIFDTETPNYDGEPIKFVGESVNQTGPHVSGKLLPSFLQSLEKAFDFGIKIDFSNKIVIVESDETSYDDCYNIIERLALKSNISHASALILASFVTFKTNPPNEKLRAELYDEESVNKFTLKVRKLLKGRLPVIFGFPMGHLRYKLTVPYGLNANVNLETGDITLLESPYSDK